MEKKSKKGNGWFIAAFIASIWSTYLLTTGSSWGVYIFPIIMIAVGVSYKIKS